MINIKTVTVIGANGTMGSLVAGIISSFGDAKIYLISRKKEDSINIIDKIKKSVRSDIIEENLIPTDYSYLKTAIQESDWIFESIIEDYEAKIDLYKKIDLYNTNEAIVTTGTSGLSINKLALAFSKENRKRFLGTHLFNPPYNLNLCELIPSQYTDMDILNNMKEYLTKVLYRNTIVINDVPGFLANRIGFEFLNELLILAKENEEKGGIDYIDSLFSGYTGRAMKPLETIDFVGLDVHKAIVDNIYNNTDDEFRNEFALPGFMEELIENGKLGKKTNEGLYRKIVEDGVEKKQVYDIKSKKYREVVQYKNSEINNIIDKLKIGEYIEAYKILTESKTQEMKLVLKMLIKYIIYSLIMSNQYAEKLSDCEDAMVSGFNWCPPAAMLLLLGGVTEAKKIIADNISKNVIDKYNIYSLIEKVETNYDYRKYLKATY